LTVLLRLSCQYTVGGRTQRGGEKVERRGGEKEERRGEEKEERKGEEKVEGKERVEVLVHECSLSSTRMQPQRHDPRRQSACLLLANPHACY
jgi:hypothetical protein